MKAKIAVIIAVIIVMCAAGGCGQKDVSQKSAEVNGVTLSYVKTGEGPPMVLLHGGGGSHENFDHILSKLGKKYTVYAIDNRGHGGSSKVKELHYQDMADDVVEFLRTEKIEKPILYGFSDGGIVGLMVAYQHPDLLGRLIISGANAFPEGMEEESKQAMEQSYQRSGDPELAMELKEPHMTADDLQKITVPTYVLAGSQDMIKESHTRFIAKSIPGSTLRILKGETHMSYVLDSDRIAGLILDFCEE